ncbi:AraC family transcriptional regulator [Motilibacter sp. E257]|uniref:AraC family transcriptional regulator n=2 Tax=Motilibacter deserti TaxID=2714956 RepID=A0ABX0GYS8_9ACTN|nr:AraC family transcriptional regulator [Motilibacter deserti]
MTVLLTLEDPLHMAAHPDPAQPGGLFDALVGGLHTTPALITHDGRQSGIQLALSPLAARAVLGLPAGELAGLDVHAEDVLGPRVRRLRERLLAAPGWPQRFALLDAALAGWARDAAPPREVAHAWHLLHGRSGRVRVDELAREVGWSRRHLQARFRAETGLTPKQVARVVRFDRARRALQAAPRTPLAELAVAHGYYDQAHLAREFVALAGVPPSRWVRDEGHAFVQAEEPVPAAG